jgi:hypothetical protein
MSYLGGLSVGLFRQFAAFWAVSGTIRKFFHLRGCNRTGENFFKILKKTVGKMP